jgi:hypothetical protein
LDHPGIAERTDGGHGWNRFIGLEVFAGAAMLLRTNRSAMNLDYLARWSQKLTLTKEIAEIWGEAFPGEPLSS